VTQLSLAARACGPRAAAPPDPIEFSVALVQRTTGLRQTSYQVIAPASLD
jgi:hypothetical protein